MLIRRFAILIVTVSVLGCGSAESRKPTYPVTGRILLADGKPVAHATVVLHPIDGSTDAPKPRGKVDRDGTFTLTTYDGGDGAPSGRYRVTVELWLAGPRQDDPPTNRLPLVFSKPESSGLSADVTNGPTDLGTIRLRK
jgi:hypothetical protein